MSAYEERIKAQSNIACMQSLAEAINGDSITITSNNDQVRRILKAVRTAADQAIGHIDNLEEYHEKGGA